MSEGYTELAARVNDPVKHSELDVRIGLAVLAVIGGGVAIAVAPLTFGGSVVLMTSLAAGADFVGEIFDASEFEAAIAERRVSREGDDVIEDGAATVFVDEPRERAAKAHPLCTLDHPGQWVTHGSHSILVENTWAARLGGRTSCGGYISFGSETVFYGGRQTPYPGAADNPDEVSRGFYANYQLFVALAGLIGGMGGRTLLARAYAAGIRRGVAAGQLGRHAQNVRAVNSGRLRGYSRVDTDLPGGRATADEVFRALTGRNPVGPHDRVVLSDGLEVMFREQSRTGVPKLDITNPVTQVLEKITFR